MKNIVITIDGPAASGKGSFKKISNDINLYYLETGNYYRAFASLFNSLKIKKIDIASFILNINKKIENIFKKRKAFYLAEILKLHQISSIVRSKRIHC